VSILYIVIIVFYLIVELIIIGNKQELIIIKELFEEPVGDYCIVRNTIKCLVKQRLLNAPCRIRCLRMFPVS